MSDASTRGPPAAVHVRRATAEDAPAIAVIHAASIRGLTRDHYTDAQISAWSAGKEPESYRRALAAGEVMFVAEAHDGSLAGFAGCQGDEVRAVYVAPGRARRGIGTALLAAIEVDALARGETHLRLDASLNARSFYAARGYVERERAVHALRAGDGATRLECVVMSKVLAAAPR